MPLKQYGTGIDNVEEQDGLSRNSDEEKLSDRHKNFRSAKNRILQIVLKMYRVPGFSPSYNLAPPPTPESSTGVTQEERQRQLADARREGGGWGEDRSYDGEMAWSSINPSILSGIHPQHFGI
jgi:hypothetical protein